MIKVPPPPKKKRKFKEIPLLGHSSQEGLSTPALHASQNQGSVGHTDSALLTLTESETP